MLEAKCEGLDVLFQRFVATPDLRSPFRIRADAWPEADTRMIQSVKALALLARRRAREGSVGAALTLLADGMFVVRDLRKGPVSMLTAMISVAAEGVLGAHFSTLLIAEPNLNAEPDAVRTRLRRLVEVQVDPALLLTSERESFVRELIGGRGYEDTDAAIVATVDVDVDVCNGMSVESCVAALVALPQRNPPSTTWSAILGPRVTRSAQIETSARMLTSAWPRYLARLLNADVGARILEVLLELARRRAVDPTTCPPTIEPALLITPLSDHPIAIQRYDRQTWEVSAPELRAFVGDRTVAYFACPAATASWIAVD